MHFVALASLVFFKVFCRGKCHGEDYIVSCKDDGFIIASNHASYLDWMVLWSYFYWKHDINLTFLAKEKLYSHPLWGAIMRQARCIKVSDCGTKIIDQSGHERLAKSKYIGIFPEGTRSQTGQLLKAKNGAVKLSVLLNKQIIPTALCGFYQAWPPRQSFPKPTRCSINFGKPILFASPSTQDSSVQLSSMTEELMNNIAALLRS